MDIYENMFDQLDAFAEEAENWSNEKKQRVEETAAVVDTAIEGSGDEECRDRRRKLSE